MSSHIIPSLGTALRQIKALSPSNDDFLQQKAGAWSNRTVAQVLADVMASGQLPFPAVQNPSAGPNTLDDYEEGTFTPVLSYGTTNGANTYSTQLGNYIKVGRLVQFELNCILTAKFASAAGIVTISGLPFQHFTSNSILGGAFNMNYATGLAGSFVSLLGYLAHGATAITLVAIPAANSDTTQLLAANISAGSALYMSGIYQTNN